MKRTKRTVWRNCTRGFLRYSDNCLRVVFSAQFWAKGYYFRDEIVAYFASQGYAEAVPLPWERTPEGLIVKDSIDGFYAVAVNSDPNYPPF